MEHNDLTQLDGAEFKKVIANYEAEKQTLQSEISNIEKEHIIKSERLNQLKTNLVSTYGTDDPEELKKILNKNLEDLSNLKNEIDSI